MLLYTRLAPPKVPKKRSRAGCNYCKEKKKKCDEARPNCARCVERDQPCVYEPIRPRQRRKRESTLTLTLNHPQQPGKPEYSQFDVDSQTKRERRDSDESLDALDLGEDEDEEEVIYSPLAPPMAPKRLTVDTLAALSDAVPWSPTDLAVISPAASGAFDFGGLKDSRAEEDVEEVIRRDSIMSHASSHSSLGLMPHVPVVSPYLEFSPPSFSDFSTQTNRRALVDHFCGVLSHLIVFREDNGNPFQQLVLPLSYNSPTVMNSIYALASAHMEFRGIENREKSVYFHNKAIQGLARMIERGPDVNRNELLAAIMLLVYYEVLVQKARSNIVDGHLKGAMTIMSNSDSPSDNTSVFLERAFRFYDVIAALSFGTAPLSTAPGHGCLSPFPPLDSRGITSPVGSIDALLGMATSLWPIIHRMSTLPELKAEIDVAVSRGETSKVAVLRTEFETTAKATEAALQSWQPTLPPGTKLQDPEATTEEILESGRLHSILNNALAYRHSALVYLYRTIYNHPRSHPLVQTNVHASLTHCVGTVSNEGPMGALLWPLFVAACEATDQEDRSKAEQTFVAIDKRQGMTNIERAWCIVQEVWRRADEEDKAQKNNTAGRAAPNDAGDLWRRVTQDMGMTIVFG
ncbi:fungal-specific transcription factor domain-containing protein [Stachybotrys elegans]|uniref:Fungal-specific transcription factor domain-containing protein n=1 Tax=Stachybotrys elegans TaxID=80388 RepID=A0A8K0WS11_9HYPO|nr:fungal-specific transcription factor domain-containing protein [Stachybotrys elegans]